MYAFCVLGRGGGRLCGRDECSLSNEEEAGPAAKASIAMGTASISAPIINAVLASIAFYIYLETRWRGYATIFDVFVIDASLMTFMGGRLGNTEEHYFRCIKEFTYVQLHKGSHSCSHFLDSCHQIWPT